MSKLNPCPFCGGDDIDGKVKGTMLSGDELLFAFCNECEAGAPLEIWNTRAPQSEWISVDEFRTDKDVLVHAYCNDIVNGWVEHLMFTPSNELFYPHGTRYPAIVTHVQRIELPEPPKGE